MKQFVFICFTFAILLVVLSCNAQSNEKKDNKNIVSSKVEVYYFHFTHRCATCKSVEENAKKSLEALYAAKVKSGEFTFKGINLDDAGSKSLAEKYGIGGQTLMVVCGNKKIDITDKGFLNAQDPDKMKIEIKKAVEQVLKG